MGQHDQNLQDEKSEDEKLLLEKLIFDKFSEDPVLSTYMPDAVTIKDMLTMFSAVLRAMAIRAVRRGLSSAGSDLDFNHIASFDYRDSQKMTTITGLIAKTESFNEVLESTGLNKWNFYTKVPSKSELIPAHRIEVPTMTIKERMTIDRLITIEDKDSFADNLEFYYGDNRAEHKKLMQSYRKYYKYLPYYSRVTY